MGRFGATCAGPTRTPTLLCAVSTPLWVSRLRSGGHIGCYRDEKTKQPVEYMVEIPEYKGQTYIIVDPMLATGNSAKYATDILKRHGVPGKNIRFMALVAAPEGVGRFHEAHPDVYLLVAAVDSHLDENAYIIPGLGDAGDRLFGTAHE